MVLRGLKLITVENFNSIPGLVQWNDGRERVQLSGGRVMFWGDKSTQANNFQANSASAAPYYEKGIWVYSNDSSIYLRSPRKDYNFLHNGSKFGIYLIQKTTWSLGTPVGLFGAINYSNAAGTGLQGVLSSSSSSGRFGFILRGGASSSTKQITNLLNASNANYTPSDSIIAQSFVNFGQTGGIEIRYGNAVTSPRLTPFFPTLGEYPQGPNFLQYAVTATAGQTVRVGMILVYNWTGYSDAQVEDFDLRVRNLLNQERIKFQQLDI